MAAKRRKTVFARLPEISRAPIGAARVAIAGLMLAPFCGQFLRAAEPSAADLEFFETKVRPILVEHCYKGHSTSRANPKATSDLIRVRPCNRAGHRVRSSCRANPRKA